MFENLDEIDSFLETCALLKLINMCFKNTQLDGSLDYKSNLNEFEILTFYRLHFLHMVL